ncbi:MAG: VanZ family protein [Reichenbachiella sp.]|uniref:VanZ family protein n=1 Tax=Reichenbachiella sp. TaxID=2184521 RepID=UPI0032640F65
MDDKDQAFRHDREGRSSFGRCLQRINWEIIVSRSTSKILAAGWTGFILIATLSPKDGIPDFEIPIPHFDKIVHFGLFSIYAVLVSYGQTLRRGLLIGALLGILLAALTECLQFYVPGREPDKFDFIADCCGTATGLLLIYFVKKNE